CALLLVGGALAKPDPYLIVPGRGFGAYGPSLTLAQMEKKMVPGDYLEGESLGRPSAEIFAMDPFLRITMVVNHRRQIRSMFVHGYMGKWHTAEGIRLGTSLARLEQINGRPFRFHALSNRLESGRIIDWQGGNLARRFAKVRLTFASAMHSEGYSALTDQEKIRVEKAGLILRSNEPPTRKLNPIVETIELAF
ncbi:MAG: hypothetical protein KIS61_29650, partial [Candidatus Eremiobacteraeota bacterium]|nr:hypothetical protein [Candidatus Eremiobacteraeota bacterium]